jgi:hypothetical protein
VPGLLLSNPTRWHTGETGFPRESERPRERGREALHHAAHVRHAGTGRRGLLLRRLGDDGLGGEDVLRD